MVGYDEGKGTPVSGTSVGRMTLRICSIDCRSGLSPPCIVKIFSSMMAAIGRQLKQSVKVFHSLMLYRRLPGKTRMESRMKRQSYTTTDLEKRTFVIKAVDPIDTCTLVISTKNEEVFRIFDFVGKEQTDGF